MPSWNKCTTNTKDESCSEETQLKTIKVHTRYAQNMDRQLRQLTAAYTQVKMEDAPKFLIIPKSECPDVWIRLPRHKWPKSWSNIEDPVVLLERNVYGHPLAGFLWGKQFEVVLLGLGFTENKNCSYRDTWMISKGLETSRILLPCGKIDEKCRCGRTNIIS